MTQKDSNLVPYSLNNNSTVIQDAWNMTIHSDSESVTSPKHSFSSEVQIISDTEVEIEASDSNTKEIFEDMISEEIVITSEDLFLNNTYDDSTCYSVGSSYSEIDAEDRNLDQGYESIDSPDSPTSDVDTLSELFPNLL